MPRPPKPKRARKTRSTARPIRAVTFDCYGTLVDWRRGLGDAIAGLLPADAPLRDDPGRLFDRWECIQFGLLAGEYRPYRQIIQQAITVLLDELGVTASPEQIAAVPTGVHRWPLFDDVQSGIDRLIDRYGVGIVSNIDDDLLRGTLVKLGRLVTCLSTAERARAYKPHSTRPFELVLDDFGLQPDQVLHAAFGHRYDLGPARELGFRTAWVNRGLEPLPEGFDADYEVPGLNELCELLKV